MGTLIILLSAEFAIYSIVMLYKRLYLRPIMIYGLFLFPYPLVSSIVYHFDLISFYPWVPYYPEEVYIKALEISIVALFPIALLPWTMKREVVKAEFILPSGFKLVRQIFLLIFLAYLAFSIVNFKNLFINHYGDIIGGRIFTFVTLFDYFLYSAFIYRLAYLPSEKLSKVELSALGIYGLIKIMSGGRMFLVVFALSYLVHYIKQKGGNILSIRKLIPAGLFLIFLLGFTVSIRERSFNVVRSFYSLSIEYINCYISALKTSSLSTDFIGTNFTFLIDPIMSFVPSGLYSRENFFHFQFIESIGGYYAYSPIGGIYLPHQLYLILPNYFFVFVYFVLFAYLLYTIDRLTYASNKYLKYNFVYSILIFLQSMFLVFSVRHYFFVHIKHLIIVVVFGVVINVILNMTAKSLGRNLSNKIL